MMISLFRLSIFVGGFLLFNVKRQVSGRYIEVYSQGAMLNKNTPNIHQHFTVLNP